MTRLGPLLGLLIVTTIALVPPFWPRSRPDRSFMPEGTVEWLRPEGGNLRPETGSRKTGDVGRGTVDGKGFRTRAMSGLASEAERAWAERNGLTPPLAFSHHLAAIFPPALHAQHPEFFPFVNGERMRPRDGARNWNPDLGREDVAAWAANAARRYFDANPGRESFSVGVNDGLIFGESAETLAMLRRKKPRAETGDLKPETGDLKSEAGNVGTEGGGQWAVGGGRFSGLLPLPVHRLPSTVRWFRGRPDLSNLVFGFTNRVARDVAASHPGKYVGALAYYWCENAPDFPLEPNVIPFLTADRSQGYDEAFRCEELELQRRWAAAHGSQGASETRGTYADPGQVARESHERDAKADDAQVSDLRSQVSALRFSSTVDRPPSAVHRPPSTVHRLPSSALSSQRSTADQGRLDHGTHGIHEADAADPQVSGLSSPLSARVERRLGLYDYLYGSGFLIPRIHTRLIADNLRQARRLGFTDYYAEVNPNWGLDGPMPWLVAHLLRDPEQSREVLLEEYYGRNFEEAVVPMRRFFERCERQWMHQPGRAYWLKHYRNESQAGLFPSAVCRELRGLLDEAARQAQGTMAQARVKFVSDAFGVTERFVAFCEARDALNRAGLTRETHGPSANQGRVDHEIHGTHERDTEVDAAQVSGFSSQVPAGARYQAAREEFIGYTRALMAREPRALAPFRWEDYLRHKPPLGDGKQWTIGSGRWTADDAGWPENLLSNGDLHGPLQKPKRIGGLDYGVAMPEGWIATVEPAEGQSARVRDGVLRLERNKETFVYQWLPVAGGASYRATVQVRGCVQPSTTASLTLSWLDERQTPLGIKIHRLPEGAWPEWVTLEVAQDLPAEARWIGTGVRVQHQLEGGVVEVREFRLEGETETVGGDS